MLVVMDLLVGLHKVCASSMTAMRCCSRRVERVGMFQLKGCIRCGGDLSMNYEDWQCLQCGRYYYKTVPWSYDRRREGAWGNSSRVSKKRDELAKIPAENESTNTAVGV